MKKKQYFILLGILAVIALVVVVVYLIMPKEEKEQAIKRSEEYLRYAEIFNFEERHDEYYGTYYVIKELKTAHQNDLEIYLPESIDGILVRKWIGDNNNFDSYKRVHTVNISKNIIYIGTSITNSGILNGGSLGDNIMINSLSELVSFIVDAENSVYASIDGILFSKDLKTLIRYPNQKAGDSAKLQYVVPDGVEVVYDKAFYYNQLLNTITFADSVREIGESAFYKCNNLTTANFGSGLKTIYQMAFRYSALQNVDLPYGTESIYFQAFSHITTLLKIYLPETITYFGDNLFTGHDSGLIIETESDNVSAIQALKLIRDDTKVIAKS